MIEITSLMPVNFKESSATHTGLIIVPVMPDGRMTALLKSYHEHPEIFYTTNISRSRSTLKPMGITEGYKITYAFKKEVNFFKVVALSWLIMTEFQHGGGLIYDKRSEGLDLGLNLVDDYVMRLVKEIADNRERKIPYFSTLLTQRIEFDTL